MSSIKMSRQNDENIYELRELCEQTNESNDFNSSRVSNAEQSTENPDFENTPTPIIIRPCFFNHTEEFAINGKKMKAGLYLHYLKEKGNENIEVDDWISTPIVADAITSSIDGKNFGRLLRFVDIFGKWHEWSMPMHLLNSSGDILLAELLGQGLVFDRRRRQDLINYVMSAKPPGSLIAVDKVGWSENKKTFILPNKTLGDQGMVFQSEYCSETEFKTQGTLHDWKNEIGKLCVGNMSLIFAVSASLAGPLLQLVNRKQGAGIHFVGDSSSGKSTLLEIAASLWGSPDFIRSWSSTANGMESIATTRNDTVLLLDEIDEVSPLEIGKISYMLVNGQGKQRAGKTGHAKKIQRWSLIAISTGERSLWSVMNDVQKQPNPGQLVRLLNMDSKFEYGVFSNLHGFDSGHTFSNHLKVARLKNYGLVGPAFVSELLRDKTDISESLKKLDQIFSKYAKSSLEKRAATTFALIGLAGELAVQYGLLPWDEGASLDAALDAFNRWKNFNPAGQTEDERILHAIKDFIDKYGDSRFSSCLRSHQDYSVNNRAGWYKDPDNELGSGRTYMFTSSGITDACGNKFEVKRIVSAVVDAGWLTDHDKDRKTKKTTIAGTKKGLYHIRIKESIDES